MPDATPDYPALLDAVYQSEIHFEINAHWDEGFRAWIVTGGGIAEFSDMMPTFAQAAEWVCVMAVKRWPQSSFAQQQGMVAK